MMADSRAKHGESVWERLRAPFPAECIEWRVGRSGVKSGKPWAVVLAYVTNRAIMDRLDGVLGPENWWNHYQPAPVGEGMMCGITVRLPDGREITKWDGAEPTEVEPLKGCISGAMKRAAVLLGCGRYLYELEDGFANIHERGRYRATAKEGGTFVHFRWDPPELPAWALPGSREPLPAAPPVAEPETDAGPDVTALLDYITAHAPKVGKGAGLVVDGKEHNFRTYVQSNWLGIVSTPSVADAVAKVVEKETGVAFKMEAGR